MRRGPAVVLAVVAVAVALSLLALKLHVPPGPRSVVLVTIDTLRADRGVAARGGRSLTPHLDALAARGARFDQVWTVAPLTVPAHATLMTGRLPAQHGLRTNEPRHGLGPRASRGFATVAEAMRTAGCRTAAFVSASVLRRDRTGLDAGFEVYDEVAPAKPGSPYENERRGEETVDAALAWLRGGEGPYFLWVHLFDPHAPYDAPLPFGAGSGHVSDEQGYDGEVAYADHCLGRLVDGLAGRSDVAVAVVADHGESLGEHGEKTHGYLLHEATLRVPLAIADGVIPAGTVRTDPVSTREIAATLLTLARVQLPDGMPGTPLFAKHDAPAPLYAETFYGYDAFRWAQTFALRRGDAKVVSAGPEVRTADLRADPREEHAAVLDASRRDAWPADASAVPGALDVIRHAAAGTVASESPAPTGVEDGAYWGGTGTKSALLPDEANRKPPSPYLRIADVAILDTAQALLAAGAPEPALVQADEAARRDPANPQAQFLRARALAALRRHGEAVEACRRTLDLGWLEPRVVEKALQVSVQAGAAGDAEGPGRALRFFEDARGRGVRDTCDTWIFVATAHLLQGDRKAAGDALDRARNMHPTPEQQKGIDQVRKLIEERPK